MDTTLQKIFDSIVEGDQQAVTENVQAALNDGTPPGIILNQAMIAAMREVGSRFEQGDFYVPEMLISARAMQKGLAILKPVLKQAEIKATGKIVIGTVKGDLHDIGKNLVGMMLEGAGFEVVDLGTDITPDEFVEAVQEHEPDLVGLSALLTTTMPNMKTTIEALEVAGLRAKVKVVVGGAPVTEQYARQIGADGYSADASRAVTLANMLVSSN